MICDNCQNELLEGMNFCPCCGKSLNRNKKCKYHTKEEIDADFKDKNLDAVWKAIEDGSVYAEYIYEEYLLSEVEKIKVPDDFKTKMSTVIEYKDKGNEYAKYLYYYCMVRTFRERGLVSGFSMLLSDEKKYDEGVQGLNKCFFYNQASAQFRAACVYFEGYYDFEKNERKAFKCLQQAAKANHPGALLKMAEIYEKGMQGIKSSHEKSKNYRMKAAFWGVTESSGSLLENAPDEDDMADIAAHYSLHSIKNMIENSYIGAENPSDVNDELMDEPIKNLLDSTKKQTENDVQKEKKSANQPAAKKTEVKNERKNTASVKDEKERKTSVIDSKLLAELDKLNKEYDFESGKVSYKYINDILNDPSLNYLGIENRRHTYEESLDMVDELLAVIDQNMAETAVPNARITTAVNEITQSLQPFTNESTNSKVTLKKNQTSDVEDNKAQAYKQRSEPVPQKPISNDTQYNAETYSPPTQGEVIQNTALNSPSLQVGVALNTAPNISLMQAETEQNNVTPPKNEIPKSIKGKIGLVLRLLLFLPFLFLAIISFAVRPLCGFIALIGTFVMCPVGMKKIRDKIPGFVQVILSIILMIASIAMYPDVPEEKSDNSDSDSYDSIIREDDIISEKVD